MKKSYMVTFRRLDESMDFTVNLQADSDAEAWQKVRKIEAEQASHVIHIDFIRH